MNLYLKERYIKMNDLSRANSVIRKYFKMNYFCYDNNMSEESFGQYIWQLRTKKLKATRDAVADQLNISSSHLYNLERGIRKPSRELVIAFSKLYKEPSETLFKLLVGNPEENTGLESDKKNETAQNNLAEPEYLYYLSTDPNLPQNERDTIADIIRRRYAEAKRNAEELRKIPPGINRPAKIIKPE
jgi:transcriptional regulator with XRE-family HTH domain